MTYEITKQDVKNFIEFIHRKTNLALAEKNEEYLRRIITGRIEYHQLKSLSEYFDLLESIPGQKGELQFLYSELTVGKTSFFRLPFQFTALKNEIFPKIIKENIAQKQYVIRIWSAGCSTGEEPYSIAMTLLEMIKFPMGWDIEILATDLNKVALDFAQKGIYQLKQIKDINEEYKEKYFNICEQTAAINDDVKNLVKFQQWNLKDDLKLKDVDIIFCRNLLIYFDKEARLELIDRIYDSLKNEGYLFLGDAEPMHLLSKKFEFIDIDRALVYQKR